MQKKRVENGSVKNAKKTVKNAKKTVLKMQKKNCVKNFVLNK